MNNVKKLYKLQRKQLKKQYNEEVFKLKQEYKTQKNVYFSTDEYKQKMVKINGPKRSLLEEIGNAVTHGIGAGFAVIACFLMLIKCDVFIEYFSAILYSAGLFLTFTASCLYHSFKFGTSAKRLFRRFDYLCIYILIGATFTPILLCFLGGDFGTVFFAVQWIIILAGVSLIAIFGPSKLKNLHFVLYIALGWSALIFIPQMLKNNLALFTWILGGGVLYTIGAIPFKVDKKVMHFIWHFFVLFGAIVQWIGIYLYIF